MSKFSFFRSIEGLIFLIGCCLLAIEVILFALFGHYIPELKENLFSVIAAYFLGGRGVSISLGLNLGLSKFLVISILVFSNLTFLFVLYPSIIYFYEHLIEMKFIGKIIGSFKHKAEKYQPKIEKWGSLGLAFFVWAPLFSSGALVGAIIGSLIGMRTITVICVVTSAMIASVISWTFAFDYLFKFATRAGKIIPSIFVGLILGIAIFYRLRHLYSLARQKIKLKKSTSSNNKEKHDNRD
ncbi:small multi-drug export protein [bacterium]|nr:small multi-drug export protein [bacterium]